MDSALPWLLNGSCAWAKQPHPPSAIAAEVLGRSAGQAQRCLHRDDGRVAQDPEQAKARQKAKRRSRSPIRCRACGQTISDMRALFSMRAERVTRVFANPHGHLHEIITVRDARNTLTIGPPTTDFTWYPGYAWEVGYCARCQAHLGWLFTAVSQDCQPSTFWGLLRRAIVESSESGSN